MPNKSEQWRENTAEYKAAPGVDSWKGEQRTATEQALFSSKFPLEGVRIKFIHQLVLCIDELQE
jgi:hypothetical protein